MKRLRLSELDTVCGSRPPSYRDDVLQVATIQGDFAFIEDQDFEDLVQKYSPGKLAKVGNLARRFSVALKDEVVAVVSGVPPVSAAEAHRRLSICQACEHFDAASERCQKCRCFLRWKTAWRAQHCPVGKW